MPFLNFVWHFHTPKTLNQHAVQGGYLSIAINLLKHALFSVASRRNLWATLSAGGLVYFPQYQQNFIDFYCFSHFQPLFLAVEDFFWAHITFERYHFQFGYDPAFLFVPCLSKICPEKFTCKATISIPCMFICDDYVTYVNTRSNHSILRNFLTL